MSVSGITPEIRTASVREVRFGANPVSMLERPDGTLYITPDRPLGPYPAKLTEKLDYWAHNAPERVFIAQRERGGDWRTITYAQARSAARSIAQGLLGRPLSAERPVVILSYNDIEQAMLMLGCMYAGVPFAPVSSAYSLVSRDHGKLKQVFQLLTPGLVFTSDLVAYKKALAAVLTPEMELVTSGEIPAGVRATHFKELESTEATPEVDAAHARVTPDTIAKFLFTSGSTGQPKAVINTQRMLCSNQELIASILEFVREEPPILCDWLPWNHTFAGNHDFGLVLYNGGSLYLDEGRPTPGGIEASVRNLIDVRPTIYLNVPRGFEALAGQLRARQDLREAFFSRMKLLYYAGAGLSQSIWDEMECLAVETTGQRIQWITGLGSTETAPSALFSGKDVERAGEVGLPAPGCEVKLVPADGKLELRLRGPGVTPGYWRQPELSAHAFDEEGYYRMGDALRFVDPRHPEKGFAFDGRIAEDFKLSTGTWVSVGPLRSRALSHGQPWVQDLVIAGADRTFAGALIFPGMEACRALCPHLPRSAAASEVLGSEAVRNKFRDLFGQLAQESTGSSTRIARALLLETPPSIDVHEITDKGSLNQGAVLRHRAALLEELYAPEPGPRVLVFT